MSNSIFRTLVTGNTFSMCLFDITVCETLNMQKRVKHNKRIPVRLPAYIALLFFVIMGWSGGAMVLGKLPVSGRPTVCMIEGQGPTALAVGAGGGYFDIFTLLYLFLLFVGGRRVVRWCWVNFQCRGVLQFGLQ